MKRVFLSIFLTVFAVGFALFSGSFIDEKLVTLEKEFNGCYKHLREEDFYSAEEKLDKIVNYWKENKMKIGIFTSGEARNELEDEIKKLRLFIHNGNTDYALESISESLNILLSIRENEKLSFEAIF